MTEHLARLLVTSWFLIGVAIYIVEELLDGIMYCRMHEVNLLGTIILWPFYYSGQLIYWIKSKNRKP